MGLAVLGFAGCLVGDLYLGTAEVQVTGSPGDRAGYALDIAGDLNGDGKDDLVMSAPQPGVDQVYVFFGPISPSSLSTMTPDVVYTGPSHSEAGWAIAVRDITGDGKHDLVVAAPSEDSGAGTIHVLAGPLAPGSYTSDDDHSRVHGFGNGYFGWDVDVGDFNGDKQGDLAVGACGASYNGVQGGAVFVLDGPLSPGDHDTSEARGHYFGEFDQGLLGCAVAAVGDVGAYGHDGLLVGAYQETWTHDTKGVPAAGAAYLLYEPPTMIKTSIREVADATFLGVHAIHNAGYSLGGRGDFNADGHADILIGAPGQYCTYYATFFGFGTYCDIELPPESVHMFLGGGTPAQPGPFGSEVPPVPRLSGTYMVDTADMSIYASHPDPGIVPNPIHHSTFGMSVAWTNSTGRIDTDDIIIGAPKLNRAYLVWGVKLDKIPSVVTIEDLSTVFYLGDHADEHAVSASHFPDSDSLYGPDAAGLAVAGSGDIDHDWIEDVAIAAPGQLWFPTGPTPRPGRVFVMYGSAPDED